MLGLGDETANAKGQTRAAHKQIKRGSKGESSAGKVRYPDNEVDVLCSIVSTAPDATVG